jgi:hypothetical protein
MEMAKQNAVAKFNELVQFDERRFPGWMLKVVWTFQHRRIDRAQKAINNIELQIKKYAEDIIQPLLHEIADMKEEIKIRANLGKN